MHIFPNEGELPFYNTTSIYIYMLLFIHFINSIVGPLRSLNKETKGITAKPGTSSFKLV